MLFTLKNDVLQVTVNCLGAEIMSICDKSGCEYLWQGDSRYWSQRAPILFPFIGRLTNGRYTYHGKEYSMGLHGFAASQEFELKEQTDNSVSLLLSNTADTLASYPFSFTLQITYALTATTLSITFKVHNSGKQIMPFAIGGHPGFRIPLESGESLEDYSLAFSQSCTPDRIGFSPYAFLQGADLPFPLPDGKTLALHHSMFAKDSLILKNMDRQVTLCSSKTMRSITISYPDMPYLGIWKSPEIEAGFLCVEPWSSLPSRQSIVEEFSCKSDLIQLGSEKTYENTWSISINNIF